MDDLRQGVTPAAHRVLDLLERLRDYPKPALPPQKLHYYHANMAKGQIAQLLRTANDGLACVYAVQAAAHLLRFAEEGDEALARMGRPSRFQETPAGQAAGGAGSDPAGNAPVRREPVAPAADLPPLDVASQEQVADFIRANSRWPVVSGRCIGEGGQGAIYELSNGHLFKLSAAELAHVTPRWDVSEPIGEEDQD